MGKWLSTSGICHDLKRGKTAGKTYDGGGKSDVQSFSVSERQEMAKHPLPGLVAPSMAMYVGVRVKGVKVCSQNEVLGTGLAAAMGGKVGGNGRGTQLAVWSQQRSQVRRSALS